MPDSKILLLGSSGYVGSAFAAELQRRNLPFYSLSRKELDYTRFELLWNHLKSNRPSFVINAAGFTGRPNVDACETARAETLLGNTLFPQALAQACLAANVPYGHVSSGCIYTGAKIRQNAESRIEPDLTKPELRSLIETEALSSNFGLQPSHIHGFSEADTPNFSFRSPPCSFYSGTKALAEEVMAGVGQGYLWRLRIPFDQFDNPRNYLSKVQNYAKVYDNVNSISHRFDFVNASLDLWLKRAPFGIYNITNPGWITTRHVIKKIQEILKPSKSFEFWTDDAEFYKFAKAPRSNCVMDVSKLLATGIKIRPIQEALTDSLKRWTPLSTS
jgi:dTDP-4-dehydrorhamnose reductase